MACNVASILSGDIKSLKTKISEDLDDGNILNKIKKYSYELSRTDCPDVVYNYFNKLSNGSLDSANTKVTQFMDIGPWMTNLSNFVREKSGGASSEFVDTLCITMNGFLKTIVDIIEKTVSVVPELFKKLDQLRKEIEQVILNFGIEIKNCVLSVLTAVQEKLNELTRSVMIDFKKIQLFMESCPCAANAIGSLFGCKKNSTAGEVVSCIRDKYNLTPTDAFKAINNFFNNTLKASIAAVYEAFEKALKYVFNLLMKPIRSIVKKYCELLNYKIDMSWLINRVGPAECFFIYTKETKVVANAPITYSGMSVLDFIKTLKSWSGCFDTVCSFSDDLSRKIKDYNERLRLAPRFWIDTYTIDIFTACIAPSAGVVTDDVSTREVFVKNQDSSKNSMVDLYDAVKQAKKTIVSVFVPYSEMGDTQAQMLSPDPESGTGDDAGNLSANKRFYSGVDERLIQLTKNIESGIKENDSYYRIYQSMKIWSYPYQKSNVLMNAMGHLEYVHSLSGSLGSTSVNTQVSTAGDVPGIEYDPFNPDIESDYKPVIDATMKDFTIKPTQQVGQSLVDFYREWYSIN